MVAFDDVAVSLLEADRSMEADVAAVRAGVKELKRNSQQSKAQLTTSLRELARAETELDVLRAENEAAFAALSQADERLIISEREATQCREEADYLAAELSSVRFNVEETEAELAELRQTMRRELEMARTIIQSLEQQCGAAEGRAAQARRDLATERGLSAHLRTQLFKVTGKRTVL